VRHFEADGFKNFGFHFIDSHLSEWVRTLIREHKAGCDISKHQLIKEFSGEGCGHQREAKGKIG
jgi:hypothetical protein